MFRKLLSYDEAHEVIRSNFKPEPLRVEETSLLEAGNRILAEDVTATLNIPPFDRSTVDGYAVKSEDTYGVDENNPKLLKVYGSVNIGEPPATTVEKGIAVEIVTGAPIPEGADAVVMTEYTERKGDDLHVFSAVAKNENITKAGADIRRGKIILRSKQVLGSREIGVLAALGMAKTRVYAIPRVAVLSTGAEVTEPGRKLPLGKIYDINAYSMSTAVLESGGRPIFMGVFPDDFAELQKALRQGFASADMIITSGGVSVGPKDVMPKVLDSLGKPGVIVCGIAIKPGKPTTVALIDGKLAFSFPGHPTSALLAFYLFARPIIQAMCGRKVERDPEVNALATMKMFSAKGRRTFVMVKLKRDGSNRLLAKPVSSGLSGAITTLAKADGFVEIPENVQFIEAEEAVVVHLLGRTEKSCC